MHNEVEVLKGLYYVGGSDRRIELFENVYPLSNGVSYNSYLYLDKKTCLLDTVDSSVSEVFFDNLAYLLKDRKLDYLVVHHLEPDHASMIKELIYKHPEVTIVTSNMGLKFLLNFFPELENRPYLVVNEGDKLFLGEHTLSFVSAPMVHWPEVMMSYEVKNKVLFSADAFGTFGALAGNVIATHKTYDEAFLSEARRYYTNIVGKYGDQVIDVLKKASNIEIKTICPLHGPIHKGNLSYLINAYIAWASYTPEDPDGVMIVYSSVYGGTANAVDILATKLAAKGVKNLVVYDASKTDNSYLISEAFRVKTIVLASTTYNAGIFVKMEEFLHDLAAHKIRKRNFAIIENGSWAPESGSLMRKIVSGLDECVLLKNTLTIHSRLKESDLEKLDAIASEVAETVVEKKEEELKNDPKALFKLTYGLFTLHSVDEKGRQDISINNSFFQVSDSPNLVMLSVNKANYSAETIKATGKFNISVLTSNVPYELIKAFGFSSGRDNDKTVGQEEYLEKTANGLTRLSKFTNAYYSCEVHEVIDCGNHILFIASIKESVILNDEPALTYSDYFVKVKPAAIPSNSKVKKVGWRCRICGYTYVGEELPSDYICPLCKHPASDFEKVEL